jgi:hypothetical protein
LSGGGCQKGFARIMAKDELARGLESKGGDALKEFRKNKNRDK